jgi:hypothetical protein
VIATDRLQRAELRAELGELAAAFTRESRRHIGATRAELERAAAQVRLVRDLYWMGSYPEQVARDWVASGRALIQQAAALRGLA